MWVMASASASAASAGLGGASSRRIRVDHHADLGLVGAAVAGHRGLDLAGCVQRDRQPAAGRAHHRDPAGLGGAHHGADVGAREDPLDRDRVRAVLLEPGLDAPLDAHQPLRRPAGQTRCGRRRRRPAAAAGRPPPRPRRPRSGSGRGRCRARACGSPFVRTGVRTNANGGGRSTAQTRLSAGGLGLHRIVGALGWTSLHCRAERPAWAPQPQARSHVPETFMCTGSSAPGADFPVQISSGPTWSRPGVKTAPDCRRWAPNFRHCREPQVVAPRDHDRLRRRATP